MEWFVSEYSLPVPKELRSVIPFTYRCPDFALGTKDHIVIIELKTERGSYSSRQVADYLQLSRIRHPQERIDIGLLGPMAPGYKPPLAEAQNYGELTWSSVPELLGLAFPGDERAIWLSRFLQLAFEPSKPPGIQFPRAEDLPPSELIQAAITHALRIAPSVEKARPSGDKVERGIDVEFSSEEKARAAQKAVKDAVVKAGFSQTVGVWLWRTESTGQPATPAGQKWGRELRLFPRRSRTSSS